MGEASLPDPAPVNLFTVHLAGADAVSQKAKRAVCRKTTGFPLVFGFGAILNPPSLFTVHLEGEMDGE